MTPRRYRGAHSPSLEEAAVEPVPQEMDADACGAGVVSGAGNPHVRVHADVLAPIEGNLDLRNDAQIRLGGAVEMGGVQDRVAVVRDQSVADRR